jgi:hypothetical protein
MRRHDFITKQRQPFVESKINVGEKWVNKVNGSYITILEKKTQSWSVHETMKGNFKVHDNGTKDLLESYILSFYKKQT